MQRDLDLKPADNGAIERLIARATRRARLALVWESLWPRLVPALVVFGLFLLVSWVGLWPLFPDWLRVALLIAFALVGIASLWPLATLRIPDRQAALARIERATGKPHRPTTAFTDQLAPTNDDRSKAIWQAHRARLAAEFDNLRVGPPSPGLARRDPYGLRFLLLLLLVVAAAFTGGGFDRIADAFRGGGSAIAAETVAARIDAWAEPPTYTGRPSIFLTGNAILDDDVPIAVPAGTELIIRIAGDEAGAIAVRRSSGVEVAEPATGDGPREFRLMLDADDHIVVGEGSGERHAWTFSVVPDRPPTIDVIAGPDRTHAGGLQVAYRFSDDYGVVAARGAIQLATPPDPSARPLVEPPTYPLTIPRTAPTEGDATTARSLAGHPWAGLEVDIALVAADAIGQEGVSDTYRTTLPGRAFTNPLAIQILRERQILALDANRAENVAAALSRIVSDAGADIGYVDFLAIRSATYRIAFAYTDDDLRNVVDYLWEIAVGIEGDPAADAMTALENAAEALREALERGAPEDEIAALTEELRVAMSNYLQALAASAGQRQAQPAANVDAGILRPEDLEQMVEDIGDLAATGATNAAEQLLGQLEQMMQNLDTTQVPGGIEREFQPGGEQLDDLGYLMQEQQRVMDETFQLQQDQNQPLPAPRTDEEAEELMAQLREMRADQQERATALEREQRILEGQTQQLIEQLATEGLDPLGLTDAARNMAEAGDRLDEGRPGMAVDHQVEAMAQMQAVAEALAEQMVGDTAGPEGDDGAQDPLGRPPELQGQRYGDNVAVPEEIDQQLARQILEAIRLRLEELGRPQIEREYLERLIELY